MAKHEVNHYNVTIIEDKMQLVLMGTGTSHGIPVIGCKCKVCRSHDKKDKRLRCSAYLNNRDEIKKNNELAPVDVVVDTGPEFRIQALKYKIRRLDAVLLTHSHADHLHGLDDLRIFSSVRPPKHDGCTCCESYRKETKPLPIYANTNTIEDVHSRFSYIFTPPKEGGGKPKLDMEDCEKLTAENPLKIGTVQILPVPIMHGTLKDSGWLFSRFESDGKKHSAVYLTDCNVVPDSSVKFILDNAGIIEHLVVDGLRIRPHSTHFSFDQALSCADKICAKHTYLTHICHDSSNKEIVKYIKSALAKYQNLKMIVKNGGTVAPGYDGLTLKF